MNPRFGTIADYPASIFTVRDREPENGDGQSFHSGDGQAQLSIYGSYNTEGETPRQYLERLAEQGVSYKHTTARYYVVSGTRADQLFYQRCNFHKGSDDILNCFTLTYPARDKSLWDPIVTRISKSLRSGQGRH